MIKAGLLAIVFGCASAYGQDAATQNTQPATEQTMETRQHPAPDVQKAHKVKWTHRPTFSVESGRVTAGTTVSIHSATPNAAIYYTTEPWIPTAESTRYTGPIPINETTHLQAIAVTPGMAWSLIARAAYLVDGNPIPKPEAVQIADGVLHSGTPLRLVTDAEISSKTAQQGDKINLVLDENINANGAVLVPRGTPVEATIAGVTKSGSYGMFGILAFQVDSFTVRGTTILLHGGGVVWGNASKRAQIVEAIPFVDAASGHVYGNEAQIKPGMQLTAHVAQDTPLIF